MYIIKKNSAISQVFFFLFDMFILINTNPLLDVIRLKWVKKHDIWAYHYLSNDVQMKMKAYILWEVKMKYL